MTRSASVRANGAARLYAANVSFVASVRHRDQYGAFSPASAQKFVSERHVVDREVNWSLCADLINRTTRGRL